MISWMQRQSFYQKIARWDTIVELPDSSDLGEYLNEAMRNIESEYEDLLSVLPKTYNLFEKDFYNALLESLTMKH